MIDGVTSKPFSAKSINPCQILNSSKRRIIVRSQQTFGAKSSKEKAEFYHGLSEETTLFG